MVAFFVIWAIGAGVSTFLALGYWSIERDRKLASRWTILALFFPVAAPVALILFTKYLLKEAFK